MEEESISCFRHFVSIVPLRLINEEQSLTKKNNGTR